MESVFERFYRAAGSRGRTTGAAGLGLSIVAEIVRHHGGTVKVTSPPETGATLTIHLPHSSSGKEG